jgi:hypothetical protein
MCDWSFDHSRAPQPPKSAPEIEGKTDNALRLQVVFAKETSETSQKTPMNTKGSFYLHVIALALWAPLAHAATLTVTTTDNASGPGDGQNSLDEALRSATHGDTIRFNIPGTGPHFIATPLGGYPVITAHNLTIDGYSQPGSVPNSNPILGGNNARIQIVLDSTGADSGANDPQNPALNSRRSTRILPNPPTGNNGYGDSENGILAVFGGDNFNVSGLSFIARRTAGSTDDPAIYAVALVNQATNAHIHGCLFGLAPGGTTQEDLMPVMSAVAAFRYRIGGDVFSFGVRIGTDGNGVNDRAEFNVVVGTRIAFAFELPGGRLAGNYVNVFPNGLTFVDIDDSYHLWRAASEAGGSNPADVTIENLENGRLTEGTVIGTNGDGVSDSDERNIFAHVVYRHHIEAYSSSRDWVLAGNYFGVGVDGVTPAPLSTNVAPDFVGLSSGETRVGSNGDGVGDDVEGNLIVNVTGSKFVKSGGSSPIVSRRNNVMNCNVGGVAFAEGDDGKVFASYYASYLADANLGAAPILQSIAGGILKGTIPAPSAACPNVELDLYLADPAALAKTNFWPAAMTHPGTFLGTFTDNGPSDLNPIANEISIDVSSMGLTDRTYLAAAASYSSISGRFNATHAITSPMSNPVSIKPTLIIKANPATFTTELSWLGAPHAYDPEVGNVVEDAGGWFPLAPEMTSHFKGRNIATPGFDPFEGAFFYRLISR